MTPDANSDLVPTALLLIAHGSRRQEANEDLEHIAEQLRGHDRYAFVQPSFLELSEPTIAEGGALCVARKVKRVVMLPYFLSAGVHARDDLTAARDELATKFPDVEFRLAQPLGRHPLLVEIVLQRAAEAITI
jgi:sirohydrochlorin ferrochelatase